MAKLIKIHENGIEEIKDTGSRVEAIIFDNDGIYEGIAGNKPIEGCAFLVGGDNYINHKQNYHLTKIVDKIIEENDEYVIFKTKNSKYKFIK